MPVAGRDLRQQRQHRVAEVARAWDQIPRLTGHEPVGLRIVELAARDRACQGLQVAGIHLIVGRHHAGDVHALGERALVAGDDRRSDAAIALVCEHVDPWVADAAGTLDGCVARAVVDDVDPVDERRNAGKRDPDKLLLVVRGNDDRDAPALEHG